MADPSKIDALLVPNMMELNVFEAMERAQALSHEMRESFELCNRLLQRLGFLHSELKKEPTNVTQHAKAAGQFANTLGFVVRFLKKYSDKKLLQRIATSSAILREVHVLHEKINVVFITANLADSPQMTEWQQHEEADIAAQRHHLEEVLRSRTNLISGVSDSTLEEALAELKSEIDGDNGEPEETIALLVRVFNTVVELTGSTIPEIPDWYIRRDDVVLGKVIDVGSFGEVYEGVWKRMKVCVKLFYMDGPKTQKDFLKEAAAWHDLSHPNVVKMHGGCHVGEKLFFVSEYATKGNFTDYFDKEENKGSLWRLFHQAAQGLAYLHQNRKVHCDIKANNILVDGNDIAKLCGFGFTHTKSMSVGMSIEEQLSSAIWKAPECLLEQGPAANPTFMSDVYSPGMSIIEVKIGGVPWGMGSDEDIINQLEDGYPRPEGLFTDKEWKLVQAMTSFEPKDRMTTEEAVAALAQFAREEEEFEKQVDVERQKEFELIAATEIESIDLEHVIGFILKLPDESPESQEEKIQHVRQAQFWAKQEAVERRNWKVNAPTTRAIQAFEKLVVAAKGYRSRFIVCVDCGKSNPIGTRFCIDCVSRLDTAQSLPADDDSVHIVLLNEISRLEIILQHSKGEEARLLSLKKEEPEVRTCNGCGEMNPMDELFCCECGNDIEIIRRHPKL